MHHYVVKVNIQSNFSFRFTHIQIYFLVMEKNVTVSHSFMKLNTGLVHQCLYFLFKYIEFRGGGKHGPRSPNLEDLNPGHVA